MLTHRESQASLSNSTGRRSFSHNLRSSIDNASSRFSFSAKGGQSSRRSISGPRSISSLGLHSEDGSVFEGDPAIARVFSTYSLSQPSRATSPIDVPRDQSFISLMSDVALEQIQRTDTDKSFDRVSENEARPPSGLSARDDSCSSISSTTTKWYKRFNRNSSAQRLSKAVETSELAFNTASTRLINPFSRRRSIPVIPKVQVSILGQTPEASIAIGGQASNAAKALPAHQFPLNAVELPYIVDACITWLIENHAQMTPGIFRVNGSSQAVKTIAQHFSAGCIRMPLEHIELPGKQMISVHDVASCLKKYLVCLPDGLFGAEVFAKLSRACDSENDCLSDEAAVKDISQALLDIDDRWKFNINLILLAFLNYISSQAKILAAEDDPKQETGFMNAFSLGIVFSPCCLGSTSGPVEMRRSSTSYSDRSGLSESTPIEEAVASARRGAKVMQTLIERWPDIAKHLGACNPDLIGQEDNVSILNVHQNSDPNYDNPHRQGLHTIVDSPIKSREAASKSHARTESVDTVVMEKRKSGLAQTALDPLNDARIDLLKAQIVQLEKERDDATHNLQAQQMENAKLFSRNLELEREVNLLRGIK